MAGKNATYKNEIVRQLYFSSTLSCAEISKSIGKSLSLTTKILTELLTDDIVLETGYARSSGGRRPLMYALKSDILYTVAIAMDQFFTSIAIMDMQRNIQGEVIKLELPLKQPDGLEKLANAIKDIIGNAAIEKSKIVGIGVGMPGFVDTKKGINYTFLKHTDKSIKKYIEEKTGIRCYIDNDSSIVALTELKFGAAKAEKNAMVINIGWGIGLGMVLNQNLFRGESGFAGEFSHIPLFNNGKLCSCGKSGCLETETSLFVIIEKAKEGVEAGRSSSLSKLLSGKEEDLEKDASLIIDAAGNGDMFAIELLSAAGYNIGRGIAILIHLLNPGVIILSGRGAIAGKIWQAPIQQALNEHCIPRLAENTEVVISTLSQDANLVGCAALVMERYGVDNEKQSSKAKKLPKAA